MGWLFFLLTPWGNGDEYRREGGWTKDGCFFGEGKKAVNKFVNGFWKRLFGRLNDEQVLQGGDGDSTTVLKA